MTEKILIKKLKSYNEEEIRVFVPRELRKALMHLECEECDYKEALKKYYYEQIGKK
jgi:hypothetical protein